MSAVASLDQIPEHLNLEDAKAAIDTPEPVKPTWNPDDPKAKPTYSFDFSWTDRAGRRYEGQFTTKILTLGEQSRVGQLQASLSGQISYDQLDPLTREINYLLARLAYALDKKRPAWAKNLADIMSLDLLQAIYAEVASHEAYFFGHVTPTSGSTTVG